MRKFLVTDNSREVPQTHTETLAGVIQTVDLLDEELDEVADLEVGEILWFERIKIERTE